MWWSLLAEILQTLLIDERMSLPLELEELVGNG